MNNVALGLLVLWLVVDGTVVFRHKTGSAENRDRRSMRLIMYASPVVYGLAIWLANSNSGRIESVVVRYAGFALMACGIALRFAAIAQLGRLHTPNVAIRADHRIIDSGLYRRVRHPSYSGALVALLGFALALGNLWSVAVFAVALPMIYLYRIREEEAALAQAFGSAYADYCRRTWRLIPWVY